MSQTAASYIMTDDVLDRFLERRSTLGVWCTVWGLPNGDYRFGGMFGYEPGLRKPKSIDYDDRRAVYRVNVLFKHKGAKA